MLSSKRKSFISIIIFLKYKIVTKCSLSFWKSYFINIIKWLKTSTNLASLDMTTTYHQFYGCNFFGSLLLLFVNKINYLFKYSINFYGICEMIKYNARLFFTSKLASAQTHKKTHTKTSKRKEEKTSRYFIWLNVINII